MTNPVNDKILLGLKGSVDAFSVEISSINKALNSHRVQLDEMKVLNDLPGDFEAFKNSIIPSVSSVSSSLSLLNERFNSIKKEVDSVKNQIEHLKDIFDQNKIVSDQNSNRIEDYKSDVVLKIKNHQSSVSEIIDRTKNEIRKYIEDLKSDFLVPPNAILEKNDEISRKVEAAVLDGSNAMLKLGNTETAMKIMERKIENLAIQIKKVELAQQK